MTTYTVSISERFGEYIEHSSRHRGEDAYEAVQKAVQKAYGKSASFIGEAHGGGWYGQIWKPCSTGGLTSVTPGRVWVEAVTKQEKR